MLVGSVTGHLLCNEEVFNQMDFSLMELSEEMFLFSDLF